MDHGIFRILFLQILTIFATFRIKKIGYQNQNDMKKLVPKCDNKFWYLKKITDIFGKNNIIPLFCILCWKIDQRIRMVYGISAIHSIWLKQIFHRNCISLHLLSTAKMLKWIFHKAKQHSTGKFVSILIANYLWQKEVLCPAVLIKRFRIIGC